MKQFNFPLFFVVDTFGATQSQLKKVCDWFNVLTSDTNLRVPPNTPFEGNHTYYGLVNVQAMRNVVFAQQGASRLRPSIAQAVYERSYFLDDYLVTSAGTLASSDLESYQCYGSFDNPDVYNRTYWFAHGNYSVTHSYKDFTNGDTNKVLKAKEFIRDVIGKTEDALSIENGLLVIKQLQRNKVAPIMWLDESDLETLKVLSPEMYEHYNDAGFILADTSSLSRFDFGYALRWSEVVRLADGRQIPKDEFKSALSRCQLLLIDMDVCYEVFSSFNSAEMKNYLPEEAVIFGYIGADQEGNMPTRTDYVWSESHDVYFLNSEVARLNGYEYCSHLEDWVPEDDVREEPNCGYHCGERPIFKCDETKSRFMVGFEIEKEDDEDAYNIGWRKLFERTKWLKEDDGSLGDYGYELVSPVYDLFSNKMDKEIANDSDLKYLINAYRGDSCGGHINLSSTIYSPIQLFNGIRAFMPLLYSMYNFRIDNEYCGAKQHHRLMEGGEKYSSVHFKGNRNTCSKNSCVELRIVAAVRDVENLIWRRDLLRIMMENINRSERDILSMLLNDRSRLHKHLRNVYSIEKLNIKCNEYVQYAEEYNNVKLPPINWNQINKIKESRLKNKKSNDNTDNNSLSA